MSRPAGRTRDPARKERILVAAADLSPNVVISPFAGALADRMDRIRLIRVTQVVAIVQAATLAYLSFSENITIEELFLLIFALGFVNAFNFMDGVNGISGAHALIGGDDLEGADDLADPLSGDVLEAAGLVDLRGRVDQGFG